MPYTLIPLLLFRHLVTGTMEEGRALDQGGTFCALRRAETTTGRCIRSQGDILPFTKHRPSLSNGSLLFTILMELVDWVTMPQLDTSIFQEDWRRLFIGQKKTRSKQLTYKKELHISQLSFHWGEDWVVHDRKAVARCIYLSENWPFQRNFFLVSTYIILIR